MRQKVFSIILTLLIVCFTSNAQNLSISGDVVDDSGMAIAYATVSLSKAGEGLIDGQITDDLGKYSINVKPGEYQLSVSYVGYESYTNNVIVTTTAQTINVKLQKSVIALDELVVSAKKPLVVRKVDRIVFDAQQLSVVSSNAIELLRNTPGLLVSSEGDIQVIGRGEVIVLIDDRELNMTGNELTAYLRTYSSNDIEKIEVMTSPPSKYSAEGNAGL